MSLGHPRPVGTMWLGFISAPEGEVQDVSKYLVSASCALWDISGSSLLFSLLGGCCWRWAAVGSHAVPALGFGGLTWGPRHRKEGSMCRVCFLRDRDVRGCRALHTCRVSLGEHVRCPPPCAIRSSIQ